MATIVNNPTTPESGGNIGMIVGVVLLLLFGFLFIVYGLPAMRNSGNTSTTPAISVPEQIDVNINPGEGMSQ